MGGNKKHSGSFRAILLTWFMLGGLIFLFTPQTLTNKLQFAFARIFQGPLTIGRGFRLSAGPQQLSANVVSRAKYNQLRNDLANIKQWLDEERQKVEKLSGLANRPIWKGVKFVLADVITASGRPYRKLIINRGHNDGLAKGHFVLGEKSIVGTISDVSSRTAQVALFSDPSSRIPVKIAGLDVDMIMQGHDNNCAKIRFVSIKHKVKTGDVVCAQKKPGLLDTAMIAGTVAQCKRDDENPLLWDITVKPVCHIERLNEVEVIVMNPLHPSQ